MIRTWNPRTVTPPNIAFGGRLTLASATPVTTTDQTAKTTVFYTSYLTNLVSVVMDGGSFYSVTTSELSLALDSNSGHTGYQQSGKNFDLFLYSDAGTLRLVSGPAWTNDTTRATSLTQLKGVYVNSGSMTAKFDASASTLTVADKTGTYVGTMRASADGQCSWICSGTAAAGGTEQKLYLWNMYNRVRVDVQVIDSVDSFTNGTASYSNFNGSATNRVSFVRGLDHDAMSAVFNSAGSKGTNSIIVGIGLDSSNRAAKCAPGFTGVAGNFNFASNWEDWPGIGFHYLQALNYGSTGTPNTFYGDAGDNSTTTGYQWGMQVSGIF